MRSRTTTNRAGPGDAATRSHIGGLSASQRIMDALMRLCEVTVEHFRGRQESVTWRPDETAVLVGPNSGGKTSLLRAADIVLDPYRDAYRNRLVEHDYFDLDTTKPVQIVVILSGL